MPDTLPTPRSTLAGHLSVTARCRACTHDQELDLPALIERGHGDTPLLGLPLRCRCGSRGLSLTVNYVGQA